MGDGVSPGGALGGSMDTNKNKKNKNNFILHPN